MVDDVDVSAIERLSEPYRSLGPDERQIGGAAPKTLVVIPATGPFDHAYVAKCPGKHGARESVTEYLISCIGRDLPLRLAGARLVRMPPPLGVKCDVRFLSRYFLPRKNQSLMHGLEVIARCFEMETEQLRREVPAARALEREFFTVDLISDVLDHVGTNEQARRTLRDRFARMMAFDALIGANDRHPENWGLIYDALEPGEFEFAPIYDTARGLFWNSSDARLEADDARGRRAAVIEHYATHSRPLISADIEPDSALEKPNHFDVITYMMGRDDLNFTGAIRSVIGAFSADRCTRMLHSDFGRLFSRRRLEYIDTLLRFRHASLKKICRLT